MFFDEFCNYCYKEYSWFTLRVIYEKEQKSYCFYCWLKYIRGSTLFTRLL